jgi:hypothetical protein
MEYLDRLSRQLGNADPRYLSCSIGTKSEIVMFPSGLNSNARCVVRST